ncbi:hypothetical protein A0H81_10357 [Grifola frondosa]|uniref:Uncharacterized protein n=1 Tax=Grifola frondosa TaxID=5627 RepID=A0A1C7LYH7_GRIFR|nr:hypothetical protein A0H81_10357 [Grifola frondosa]
MSGRPRYGREWKAIYKECERQIGGGDKQEPRLARYVPKHVVVDDGRETMKMGDDKKEVWDYEAVGTSKSRDCERGRRAADGSRGSGERSQGRTTSTRGTTGDDEEKGFSDEQVYLARFCTSSQTGEDCARYVPQHVVDEDGRETMTMGDDRNEVCEALGEEETREKGRQGNEVVTTCETESKGETTGRDEEAGDDDGRDEEADDEEEKESSDEQAHLARYVPQARYAPTTVWGMYLGKSDGEHARDNGRRRGEGFQQRASVPGEHIVDEDERETMKMGDDRNKECD